MGLVFSGMFSFAVGSYVNLQLYFQDRLLELLRAIVDRIGRQDGNICLKEREPCSTASCYARKLFG